MNPDSGFQVRKIDEEHDDARPRRRGIPAGRQKPTGLSDMPFVSKVLPMLRRRWLAVAVPFVVVTACALSFSLTQGKRYDASASLLFRDPGIDQTLFGVTLGGSSTDPLRQAATNVGLVSRGGVARRAALTVGLPVDEISGNVKVAAAGPSDLVLITASAASPAEAARIANAYANAFIELRLDAEVQELAAAQASIRNALSTLSPRSDRALILRDRLRKLDDIAIVRTGKVQLADFAVPPSSPSSPRVSRNMLMGGVLGLVLGLAFAFARELLDRRLRDPAAIEEAFGLPVLGSIPHNRAIRKSDPVQLLGHMMTPDSDLEAFRRLRARLQLGSADGIRSVLVASAGRGEGKTTVALGLAASAAGAARVLFIDADLRGPAGQPQFGKGLTRVLDGAQSPEEAVVSVPVPYDHASPRREQPRACLDVLWAGPSHANPGGLIESARMKDLIHRAAERYDLVVIDTPASLLVADAFALMAHVDGVVVVVPVASVSHEAAHRLRGELSGMDASIFGVILNRT